MRFTLEGMETVENADFEKPKFSVRMIISFSGHEKKANLKIEGSFGKDFVLVSDICSEIRCDD